MSKLKALFRDPKTALLAVVAAIALCLTGYGGKCAVCELLGQTHACECTCGEDCPCCKGCCGCCKE